MVEIFGTVLDLPHRADELVVDPGQVGGQGLVVGELRPGEAVQQQIRDAVGRPGADGPELVRPMLDAFMRALPHTLRDVVRPEGTVVRVVLHDGGTWHARSDGQRWRMATRGEPAASVTMRPGDFWRLATRGISVDEARRRADLDGDRELAEAVTTLLAVVA